MQFLLMPFSCQLTWHKVVLCNGQPTIANQGKKNDGMMVHKVKQRLQISRNGSPVSILCALEPYKYKLYLAQQE